MSKRADKRRITGHCIINIRSTLPYYLIHLSLYNITLWYNVGCNRQKHTNTNDFSNVTTWKYNKIFLLSVVNKNSLFPLFATWYNTNYTAKQNMFKIFIDCKIRHITQKLFLCQLWNAVAVFISTFSTHLLHFQKYLSNFYALKLNFSWKSCSGNRIWKSSFVSCENRTHKPQDNGMLCHVVSI